LFVGTDDLLRLCEATGWTVEEVLTEPRRLPYYAFVAARA
jgi:hypothetical protein